MQTVLYGVNTATDLLYEKLINHSDIIVASTDGSGLFRGEPVKDIEFLQRLNKKSAIERIIICSIYVSEIVEALVGKGIDIDNIYYYDLSNAKVAPVQNVLTAQIKREEILFACYDLSCNLPTFDCVIFALLAELERRKEKKKYIQFFIIPDSSSKDSYLGVSHYHDKSDLSWRISHIVEPVFSLLASCHSVSTLMYREQIDSLLDMNDESIQFFPLGFDSASNMHGVRQQMLMPYADKGESFGFFEPHTQAKSQVDRFFNEVVGDKKAVLIVLREYEQQPQRNSDIKAWSNFLAKLDSNEFFPIILRDTYCASLPLPKELCKYSAFPIAAVDIHFRAAIYERAYISLAKTNGAFFMTNFIKGARAITFIDVDDSNPTMSSSTWEKSGYKLGEHAFLRENDFQRIVWNTDKEEVIEQAFWELYNDIEEQKNDNVKSLCEKT